jgi:sigma-E factor negative regulatory protein RseC
MTEIGRVASVEGDAAVVTMQASAECCHCGMCLMAHEGGEFLLLARNAAGAAPGDTVEVEVEARRVVAAAFAVYMVPVLATIGGFVAGNAITGGAPDAPLPIVLAVAFLVASFAVVWAYDLKLRRAERHQAVVTRVLTAEEAEAEKRRVKTVRLGG